jgi:hypothetical protein
MRSKILQLHWQFKDGHTEMRAQNEFEFERYRINKKYIEWIKGVQKNHPLPEGADWLMVTEKSEHFIGVPIRTGQDDPKQ